jgi:predicted esterase
VDIAAGPSELPKPLFEVPEPKELPAVYEGRDLSKLKPNVLAGMAMRAAEAEDYKTALAAQFWAVKKGEGSFYNLACFYARNNMFEEAVYWLQKGAFEEGVDAEWAARDPDLESLFEIPKYSHLIGFLNYCQAYWNASKHKLTVLYVPEKFDKAKPSPVVVCLHGRGGSPKRFLNQSLQYYADELGMPFVCVSGTRPTGPKGFVWAEEPDADAKRIDAALQEVSDRITVAPGSVIAMGFSEGAQVAVEVSVRDPEKYAGAIVLSPGADFHLNQAPESAKLKERRFVVTIGGNEHPGNVKLAEQDRDWLKKAGANVEFVTFPGVGHMIPRDFDERLPKWIAFILVKE